MYLISIDTISGQSAYFILRERKIIDIMILTSHNFHSIQHHIKYEIMNTS